MKKRWKSLYALLASLLALFMVWGGLALADGIDPGSGDVGLPQSDQLQPEEGNRPSGSTGRQAASLAASPLFCKHVYDYTPAKASTCVEKGNLEYWHCALCNTYFVEIARMKIPALKPELPVNPLAHSFKHADSKPATCTEDGNKEYWYCENPGCNLFFIKKGLLWEQVDWDKIVTKALGHEFERDAERDIAPTCLAKGVEAWTCVRGDATDDKEIAALGHEFERDAKRDVAPTCLKQGLEAWTCVRGDATDDKVLAKLEHKYKVKKIVKATCAEKGYTLMRCSLCGDEYKTGFTGALGHWYGLWSPDGDGKHTATCKRDSKHTGTVACEILEATVGDDAVSACPVCGDWFLAGARQAPPMEAVKDAKGALTGTTKALPSGEWIIRFVDKPFGEDGQALRLYTIAYEYGGKIVDIEGAVSVSIPMTGDLAGFKLARIAGDDTPADIEYSLAEGVLTFTTDELGMFLLTAE